MAENSAIEWTHHTYNPWRGCTKVSPGCQLCYADTLSHRNPGTLGVWGPDGTRVVAAESYWRQPLKWDREAKAAGERRRVFCASLADVFEDWKGSMVGTNGHPMHLGEKWNRKEHFVEVEGIHIGRSAVTMDDVRARLFQLIGDTPNLDWLLLTKRPENITPMLDRLSSTPFIVHDPKAGPRHERWTTWKEIGVGFHRLWPNVWLGVSVEDQQRADERIPHLLRVPAAVRFLSVEPLIGPINLDLDPALAPPACRSRQCWPLDQDGPQISWVIVGGESGHGARPMHPDWARSIRDQCVAASVPYFFKQWGEFAPAYGNGDTGERDLDGVRVRIIDRGTATEQWMARVGKKAAGRLLDGRTWDEFPKQ
jgi:protein gp37